MAQFQIFQVDAFTENLFHGNPAAVVPLETWPTYEKLQNIALENNLSETAFFLKEENHYHIRWFTPAVEVDLCGHATLATAYVIFNFFETEAQSIKFHSRSGMLEVKKENDLLILNFPADEIKKVPAPEKLVNALGKIPKESYKGKTDYLLIYATETDIEEIEPDFKLLSEIKARGIIISSKGKNTDFVSRFFAPLSGINEDPVTGSAHTTLTSYWAEKLNKKELSAVQLSKRKGFLHCRDLGNRIEIAGKAVLFLRGEIFVD
mgnify:FL=1|jgi:PhzF family phenazine biosynthesis protein